MRRDAPRKMVNRGHGSGRETQQKTIEREMVEAAASRRMVFVGIRAASAVAIQIFER